MAARIHSREDTDVMRDIGQRIKRYRLSRYAAPQDRVRRNLRWLWALGALWLVWIGFISDHSLWRLWRLSDENRHAQQQLATTRALGEEMDRELRDPRVWLRRAEEALRRKGYSRPGELVYREQAGTPDSLRR
jgi:hypothetical protein